MTLLSDRADMERLRMREMFNFATIGLVIGVGMAGMAIFNADRILTVMGCALVVMGLGFLGGGFHFKRRRTRYEQAGLALPEDIVKMDPATWLENVQANYFLDPPLATLATEEKVHRVVGVLMEMDIRLARLAELVDAKVRALDKEDVLSAQAIEVFMTSDAEVTPLVDRLRELDVRLGGGVMYLLKRQRVTPEPGTSRLHDFVRGGLGA